MTTETDTIPTWHHPHFVSATDYGYCTGYEFKAFTGDEPEPAISADVKEMWRAARREHHYDSDIGRAVSAAWRAADAEERAANTLWQVARHNRRAVDLIKKVAPLVAAYQHATEKATEAYESLHATPDGFWQAKLLTIVQLREKALAAAEQVDVASHELASTADGLPERVLQELPMFADLVKAAGVDLGDWYPQESYGYGPGPEVSKLQKMFGEQDTRIEQVTRLFGKDVR